MLKKTLAVLLAALLLLGSTAACATSTESPSDTSDATNAGTDDAATEVEETETQATLDIADTRYDGEDLCFLTRDQAEWSTYEIYTEKLTSDSDNISSAVYERNVTIIDKYGVTISELKQATANHIASVTREVAAPTGDFQAIITNTTQSGSLASQGFLWNLTGDVVENIDLQKPWWDGNMATGMSINDCLYFATGDLLTSDNDATFAILFNKKLVTECKIPDLYALVENDEWTMAKFYEFEQLAHQDKDGDGKLTYDTDICGLAYTDTAPHSFLIASGVTLCQKDENDYPSFSLNIERAQNVADFCQLIFAAEHTVYINDAASKAGVPVMEIGKTAFGENHALFLSEVMQAVTRMRGYDVDFGIMPFPKYDHNQTDYYSLMHYYASMVSIPRSVIDEDLDMVTAMIEAMAYYSVDTLTTQYYEINLKTKGAKDEKSGPMIDMILANRACDLSYYYSSWGDGAFNSIASTLLPSSKRSVSSQAKKCEKAVNRAIDNLVKEMASFDE